MPTTHVKLKSLMLQNVANVCLKHALKCFMLRLLMLIVVESSEFIGGSEGLLLSGSFPCYDFVLGVAGGPRDFLHAHFCICFGMWPCGWRNRFIPGCICLTSDCAAWQNNLTCLNLSHPACQAVLESESLTTRGLALLSVPCTMRCHQSLEHMFGWRN